MQPFNRAQLRALRAENRLQPEVLREIPQSAWPETLLAANRVLRSTMRRAWRSRDFLAMLFVEPNGRERLTFNRTEFHGVGQRLVGEISWDEIQRLKAEAGFGDRWAVECYPPDDDVVNVQNMRHIFLLDEPPPYGWHAGAGSR